MKMDWAWQMPPINGETHTVPAIKELIRLYLLNSHNSIDPFARNCHLAKVTNDLNPDSWRNITWMFSNF